MKFTHLHVHSHYSLLDGASKIDDLLTRVRDLGMSAVALTDHGVMYGAIEFYQKTKAAGLKPIIGVEAYVAPRSLNDKTPRVDSKAYHLILLAETFEGYQNLLALTTTAHLEGFYYRPRVDKKLLKQHARGLIATSACLQGEVAKAALRSKDEAKQVINSYLEIFGPDNFFLELQHQPQMPDQERVNTVLKELASEMKLGLVATNDAHYVNPEDAEAQDVLTCIASGKVVSDPNRLNFLNADLSICDPESMAEWFKDVPEAITNTQIIADRCQVEIPMGETILPSYPLPPGKSEREWLRELCRQGVKERYGFNYQVGSLKNGEILPSPDSQDENTPLERRVYQRLDYELSVIETMKLEGYFLITQDFINWARDQEILIGPGRGSAAGSLVGYVTGITDVDPIKYNIIFERFLNPERYSMPDIDNDIQDSRRDEVIEYVRQRFGQDRVAQIITFGTMQARNAVRDVGRALGLPYPECDYLAKLIPFGSTIKQALALVPELKDSYDSNERVKKLLDLGKKVEGSARHTSIHAAGVVVTPDKLERYCPLQYAARSDKTVVTQYEMHAIEDMGILKIDFLGLSNLNIIDLCLKLLAEHRGIKIDIRHLNTDDQKTYQLLSEAKTTGVFQLESAGMKRYLKELKPTEFEDIISMVALYRPGPMEAIPDFIDAKHGRRQATFLHPSLEDILQDTYGVIVTQDQVLQIARDFAGFTYGEADILRKAVGKKIKALLDEQREKFIQGAMKTQKIGQSLAQRVWDFIEPFARYGFNRAHATCYAMIAYQTAYLKANYPAEFMAALMTSDLQNLDRLGIELTEAEQLGLSTLPPDVNESFVNFAVVYDSSDISPERTGNIIRFGLGAIKNVGVEIARAIVQEREQRGSFSDLTDLLVRLGSAKLNKKVMENLAKAGALDSLAERQQILAGLEDITRFISAVGKNGSADRSQIGLFGSDESGLAYQLRLPEVEPVDTRTKLNWEKELLGIFLSDHPIKDVAAKLGDQVRPLISITPKMHNQKVRVAGLVTVQRSILTKNNDPMSFVTIEDATANLELVVFPKIYADTKEFYQEGKILIIDGFVSAKDNRTQADITESKILVEAVWEVKDEQLKQGVLPELPLFKPRRRQPGSRNGQNSLNNFSEPNAQILIITLPDQATKQLLTKLKEVIEAYPGESPVVLRLPQQRGLTEIATKSRVGINQPLKQKLAQLVGESNVN